MYRVQKLYGLGDKRSQQKLTTSTCHGDKTFVSNVRWPNFFIWICFSFSGKRTPTTLEKLSSWHLRHTWILISCFYPSCKTQFTFCNYATSFTLMTLQNQAFAGVIHCYNIHILQCYMWYENHVLNPFIFSVDILFGLQFAYNT